MDIEGIGIVACNQERHRELESIRLVGCQIAFNTCLFGQMRTIVSVTKQHIAYGVLAIVLHNHFWIDSLTILGGNWLGDCNHTRIGFNLVTANAEIVNSTTFAKSSIVVGPLRSCVHKPELEFFLEVTRY